MLPIKRGAVIEYPALFDFDSYPRPYLIVSGLSHPFHGEEYIGIAITTTALESAIPISDDAWVRGGLPKESFLKPWQPTLLKHADITDAFGVLRQTVVDRTAEELASVIQD